LYFGLIGLAYLLVEIPLIQRFILFLGHPAYALTAILFTLLLFSGLGSRLSDRISLRISLIILTVLLLLSPFLLPKFFDRSLGLVLPLRLVLTVIVLAPLGFLMGISFPQGIGWVHGNQENAGTYLIPWIWAVNGAASVVASVLAALLSLSLGFDWVLRLGALCYAAAWLTFMVSEYRSPFPPPHR
jgi:MFS family permease